MRLSRRDIFAFATAALIPPDHTLAEEASTLRIQLPAFPYDPKLRTYAAVVTSGYTRCQVRILGAHNHVLQYSPDWGTEPNAAVGQVLDGALPRERPLFYPTEILLRPKSLLIPSAAAAITQAGEQETARLIPAGFSMADRSEPDEVEKARTSALGARFITDPARPPGGHFELMLWHPSSLTLSIWPGEKALGPPLYQKYLGNRAPQRNTVPWDLKSSKGDMVKSGRYLAVIHCKPLPEAGRVQPTFLTSYFGVITT